MHHRLAPQTAALFLAALTLVPAANAQFPRREATPNDTLQSTEVLPDSRVTFRIYAPQASEVTVSGDWIGQGLGTGGSLEKDDQGVWSITVGPLPADFYSYSFTVDGVKTLDPKNPMIKQGIRGVDNMFLLPGDEATFQDNQPVPHGQIRQVWYPSSTLGMQRRMHIYTPPAYVGGAEEYPVLYLLHGGGDEDSGWSTIGRAGFILDNLLAANKAQPMLIVMPNGSLPPPEPRSDDAAAPPDFASGRAERQNRFTKELMNEIIPFVENHFRVQAGPPNRAIAGLSMGGGQTLGVITSHPDAFAYVGIWSAGLFGGNAEEWEKRNENFLAAADQVNDAVQWFEIVVGDADFALNGSKALAEVLEKHGIEHDLRITGGGHTWINWRRYLHELVPRLFTSGKSAAAAPQTSSIPTSGSSSSQGVEGAIAERRQAEIDKPDAPSLGEAPAGFDARREGIERGR